MLRIALLVLYFTHLFLSGSIQRDTLGVDTGGGLNPDGLQSTLPQGDTGGGLNPDGLK